MANEEKNGIDEEKNGIDENAFGAGGNFRKRVQFVFLLSSRFAVVDAMLVLSLFPHWRCWFGISKRKWEWQCMRARRVVNALGKAAALRDSGLR